MLVPWIIDNVQVVAQLSIFDVHNKHKQKMKHMYIGIEYEKNSLSSVDFSSIFNVINKFLDFNIYFLTNGIPFHLSYSERAIKWREFVITGLEKYVIQIDTHIYGDNRIIYHYLGVDYPFKRGIDTRVICDHIFQKKAKY